MDKVFVISVTVWEDVLMHLARSYTLFAPVELKGSVDYELIDGENSGDIIYNYPRPTTPLKTFFLPVRENVTAGKPEQKRTIIMGIPSCDLSALDILDEIYMDDEYPDIFYKTRRQTSILIGGDCHSILDNCHCTTYGVNPFPGKNADIILSTHGEKVFLKPLSLKGETLLKALDIGTPVGKSDESDIKRIEEIREGMVNELNNRNINLPSYEQSAALIRESNGTTWKSAASTCVSCGACATICPTCSCFLLIDRPGFEKIRQMDACQYPGFERVAAGEDPLAELPERLKNRYMCKYVWKPLRFKSIACTGCGRCIDACLGKINKNLILGQLASEKGYERKQHI